MPKAVDEEDEEAGFTSRLFTVVRPGDPSSGGSLHGLFCSNATCSSEEADDDGDGAKMVFCSMVGRQRLCEEVPAKLEAGDLHRITDIQIIEPTQ